MKQGIKFVYFDIGGVFVDCNLSFSDASSKFNIDRDQIDKMFDIHDDQLTTGSLSAQNFWLKCVDRLCLPNAGGFDFADSWTSDYLPIKPTYNLALSLSKKYSLGIISNFYLGLFEQLLQKSYIPDIKYHSKVLSCLVGCRKPDPQIYEIAQNQAGVKAGEILFIDDRPDFLEPAVNLGWQTCLFKTKNPEKSVEEIKEILNNSK